MTDQSGLPTSSPSGNLAIPQSAPPKIDHTGMSDAAPSNDTGAAPSVIAPPSSPSVLGTTSAPSVPAISLTPMEAVQSTEPAPDLQAVSANLAEMASASAPVPSTAPGAVSPQTPEVSPPAPAPSIQPPGEIPGVPSTSTSSLANMLVQKGYITDKQYQDLLIEQASSGKSVETLIDEKHLVKETDMTKAKAAFYNLPYINLAETGASPEAISQIPESVARRYQILPFAIDKQNQQLSVAMKNPLDLSAIDFVEKKTGYKLLPHFATPTEIERMITERYAQSLSSEVNAALKETGQTSTPTRQEANAVFSREVVREAPITKIVETILGFAVKSRASDIHIEPQEDRTRVRYRIDGILTERLILPRSVHEAVISRIKILSDMKIDEKRIPQDGRFTFMAEGQEVDLRISSLPTAFGEKIVMRLLKKNATVPTLGELGLSDRALKAVESAIKIPHGIILVTGPTGSGKTTTLYSILHKINTPKVNIVTLEDPIEYQMPGINQVQINPQAGLTFASGLRSLLRQDPNIIMVGEIRDTETASLAVQASLTGHLVFSTLHTNSAAGALPRLLDMEVEPFLLASSLTMVMAQRVLRRINQDYKEEFTPEPSVVADVKSVLGPLYKQWCVQNNKDPEKMVLYRASQNRPENQPEYLGRIAIFEVLPVTEEISRMILERKSATEIEDASIQKNGMLLMKQDGYIKALEGITTVEEVLRVAEV
ncbi:Flp pilus assembly complex ATPase component TadA [Patescibacteria group bacterium]|nr:Flp pilus assembly complex ATPase component TadA [Patescibacteria group bacterium]